MKKRVIALLAAGLLAVTALVGCGGSGGSGSGEIKNTAGTAIDGNEQKIETAAMRLGKAQQEGGYTMINTEELKKLIDEKAPMVLVDTMPKSSYDKAHIPGAIHSEVAAKEADVTDQQKKDFVAALGTDKNAHVIIYCGFVACERSHWAAIAAKEAGFANVTRHPGGIVAWENAGYETGK